ncbi:MAG TPA: non-homologous end-joining DNA ligase [Tepidisphaeraceae bacterium]|jgi:bifunctional non-homologous end joining protein LigD
MLATLGHTLPAAEDEYFVEYKWDGVRAICYHDGKNFQLRSRNNLDITRRYPELHALGHALGKRQAVLDGEIIAMDEMERPSFTRLQRRMHVNDPRMVQRLMKEVPAFYVLFDVLYLDGKSTMKLPYIERRRLLEELTVAGPYWQRTPAHRGQGKAMLEAAQQNHLEGIVVKKVDGTYTPGRRSDCWIKIKIVQRQELVIGGWIPEQGHRTTHVGALLMGYYDCDGNLRYAGSVGTGFTEKTHADLTTLFRKHTQSASSFADPLPKKGIIYLDPALVAEIEYRRWPEGGHMQQGSYKGLRMDKRAREVFKEVAT